MWPLLGFSISIDVDHEDVRLLLVSPLADGNHCSLIDFGISRYQLTFDNGRDFATLAYNVKNLIETWQDSSVCHREARALTKRLEVSDI